MNFMSLFTGLLHIFYWFSNLCFSSSSGLLSISHREEKVFKPIRISNALFSMHIAHIVCNDAYEYVAQSDLFKSD